MSAIIVPRRWTQQPTGPVAVDWEHPLLARAEFVMLGSQPSYNPLKRNITRVGSIVASPSPKGIKATVSNSNYFSYPLAVASGGTTPWTIAGIYLPITLPGVSPDVLGVPIAGCTETPGSTTYDRFVAMQDTTRCWKGHLYDGSQKAAVSTAIATVGVTDTVVVTANNTVLTCAVRGYPDVTTATLSNGYNGYTSAEFGVGRSNNATLTDTGVLLLIRTNAHWSASMRASFFANPWQIFKPISTRIYIGAGASSAFKAAWARNRSQVIGAGVH